MDTLAQVNLDKCPVCKSCQNKGINTPGCYVCIKENCPGFHTFYCFDCSGDETSVHDHGPVFISRLCDKYNLEYQKQWNTI